MKRGPFFKQPKRGEFSDAHYFHDALGVIALAELAMRYGATFEEVELELEGANHWMMMFLKTFKLN
jgi:hypothetical protein